MARDQMYNMVIVPTTSYAAGNQRFVLSASRLDRGSFLVSPEWTVGEVRRALAGLSLVEVEELFRGNRMASGGRGTKLLLFSEEQLRAMGLAPRPILEGAAGGEQEVRKQIPWDDDKVERATANSDSLRE